MKKNSLLGRDADDAPLSSEAGFDNFWKELEETLDAAKYCLNAGSKKQAVLNLIEAVEGLASWVKLRELGY